MKHLIAIALSLIATCSISSQSYESVAFEDELGPLASKVHAPGIEMVHNSLVMDTQHYVATGDPYTLRTYEQIEWNLREVQGLGPDYSGDVCIDFEPYAKARWDQEAAERAYAQLAEHARRALPKARIGVFGLPTIRIWTSDTDTQPISTDQAAPLLAHFDLLFPQFYSGRSVFTDADQNLFAQRMQRVRAFPHPAYPTINGHTAGLINLPLAPEVVVQRAAWLTDQGVEGVVYWMGKRANDALVASHLWALVDAGLMLPTVIDDGQHWNGRTWKGYGDFRAPYRVIIRRDVEEVTISNASVRELWVRSHKGFRPHRITLRNITSIDADGHGFDIVLGWEDPPLLPPPGGDHLRLIDCTSIRAAKSGIYMQGVHGWQMIGFHAIEAGTHDVLDHGGYISQCAGGDMEGFIADDCANYGFKAVGLSDTSLGSILARRCGRGVQIGTNSRMGAHATSARVRLDSVHCIDMGRGGEDVWAISFNSCVDVEVGLVNLVSVLAGYSAIAVHLDDDAPTGRTDGVRVRAIRAPDGAKRVHVDPIERERLNVEISN